MAESSAAHIQMSPQHQVFLNFRGDELRHGFVSHLVKALKRDGINVFIDRHEHRGEDLSKLFKRIEESRIALAIFSRRYTESSWCLEELVKIKELTDECKLKVIPIFYKVDTATVKKQKGEFGDSFRDLAETCPSHVQTKWVQALKSVSNKMGLSLKDKSDEGEFINCVVDEVKKVLTDISREKTKSPKEKTGMPSGEKTEVPSGKEEKSTSESEPKTCPVFGIQLRLKQLEEKIDFECEETRVLGVVGLPGIGKTTLVKILFQAWEHRFPSCMLLLDIRKVSKLHGLDSLRKRFLEHLLEADIQSHHIDDYEVLKEKLLERKVFVVLDDVSDKEQIETLLGKLDWIKKGSKIVITTSSKSLIEGVAHDTYVVPGLNDREGLQLFSYHAFGNHICVPEGNFMKLSRKFVDYATGNPLALKVLGGELRGKNEFHWESKLGALSQIPNKTIEEVFRISYEELSEQQKDAFLDVACFFTSENESYVTSLVDSGNQRSEIRDLAHNLLINICGGRVEMHDLLCNLGKELGPWGRRRLWNHRGVVGVLKNRSGTENVRGIFLDMSRVTRQMILDSNTFIRMDNLRYLKFCSSRCPWEREAECKLIVPEELKLPLHAIRCLHWLKFPLKKLPADFDPKNLIDLKLPYSEIEQIWDGVKDTSKLKWVDLNHSSKLRNLSGLLGAQNLQKLSLEGCTRLKMFSREMENMKSLAFLNLKGCTRLVSLPEMNLTSLKTLILSDCSNLEEFQVISKNLGVLHLDGTAIKGLPPSIKNLQRLILLNLKHCKRLTYLPDCLGELKALKELILSGCPRLDKFPEVKQSMKHLQILLLDGTALKELPKTSHLRGSEGQASVDMPFSPVGSYRGLREWLRGIGGLSSLRRLCLSRNDFESLQTDIRQLYHLKWLDLKYCKKLRSLPMLPPNIQFFDAHGCDSLQRVASPLALPILTEQIHATFIFTNCGKLDRDAKNNIISYARWKSQSMSAALHRYNGGFILEDLVGTCIPGSDVPTWFSDQAFGSVLQPKLPQHWCNNRLTGIALCAVVSFQDYQEQKNRVYVKCTCEFKNEDGSCISFSCTVGGWTEPGNEPRKVEQDHVFIGYTSWLDIKKDHEEDHDEKGCMPTKASLEFKVTDGTSEVVRCEVLKCGFSLVYATDETDNISWEANFDVTSMKRYDSVPGYSDQTSRRDDEDISINQTPM